MGVLNSRRGFSTLIIILFVLLAALAPDISQAQDVANGQATATVLAALSVIAVRPLDFGNVFQGVAKSIGKNEAVAGVFGISGADNAGISIYIQLPAYIALADGSDRLSISFGINDCDVDTAVVAPGPGDPTAFADGYAGVDPRNPPATINLGDDGLAALYLGGRVTPSVDQVAGAYSGDIIVTVSYNGT